MISGDENGERGTARQRFSPVQRAALSHPHTGEGSPHPACMRRSSAASEILSCDIDDETVEVFGGPVWHASASPPVRARAEKLLEGVGDGVLFDQPGMRPDIFHLRRRMTEEEIELLEGSAK